MPAPLTGRARGPSEKIKVKITDFKSKDIANMIALGRKDALAAIENGPDTVPKTAEPDPDA